ncbi:MAG TPA: 16S rRNA (adenine(1518)-N(6)/adenine(1519)-N(6))-dimethyltransferase RsmA [Elusimicrobiota bacterium]|nr:16S rRNA (adenine(1518)-N(6)/adenine(1519)-N(6))-dimethyltransferase RsmA [Elusimicrobiota bacterium]
MRQRWGQNFLKNESVAQRITGLLQIQQNDTVLEIGPGRGILSQYIISASPRWIGVEIDGELAADLGNRWGIPDKTEVIHRDFLEWPLPSFPDRTIKLIGNLPYSSASAILQKCLDWPAWSQGVFMVQKEVADRICAGPGNHDYGILTLSVQGKANVERLFDVQPGSFSPPPKVLSTVIRLRPLVEHRIHREPLFFKVLHAAFGQRRKVILNSLSHGLQMDKDQVLRALRTAGISPTTRAETLDLETYNRLTDQLFGPPSIEIQSRE